MRYLKLSDQIKGQVIWAYSYFLKVPHTESISSSFTNLTSRWFLRVRLLLQVTRGHPKCKFIQAHGWFNTKTEGLIPYGDEVRTLRKQKWSKKRVLAFSRMCVRELHKKWWLLLGKCSRAFQWQTKIKNPESLVLVLTSGHLRIEL